MRGVIHLLGNIAPLLAGLLTAPLTARSLGPEARGELAILLLVATLIGLVGALGLGLLARQAVAADLGQAHGWSRRGRRITLFAVLVATAVGYLITSVLSLSFNETVAAAVLFALAGMSASRSIDGNIMIVAGKTKQYGAANLAASITVSLGIVVSFLTGTLSLWVVVALNAASLVAQNSFLAISMRQLLRSIDKRNFHDESLRLLVLRAWRAWRSQILEAGVLRADTLLFISQTNVQTVGFYAVISLIPQMAYQVIQTAIQSSYAKSPMLRLRERTRLLWQVTITVGTLLAVGGSLVAIPLVPILFGADFLPSLEFLWPASMVTIGLAGLAPVLHHFATSPTRDEWFPVSLIAVFAISWGTGAQSTTSTGVVMMGALLLALGTVYMYLLAGPKVFRIRWNAWKRLYGR